MHDYSMKLSSVTFLNFDVLPKNSTRGQLAHTYLINWASWINRRKFKKNANVLRIKYLFVSLWCVSQELKEENKQMEVGMREILAQLKENAQKGLLVLMIEKCS